MRILVTGGCGFIGSHIVEHYQGKAEIRVLDNLRSGNIDNISGFDFEFIEGSIVDQESVQKAVAGVDLVFHLAALVSVTESMGNAIECTQLNTIGSLNILEAAARANVRKVCFSSSSAIYGDTPVNPKTESMTPEPKSPYAISKLDGEYYCQLFHNEGRVNTCSLRYFNVFGPRQDPESQYAAVIPKFVDQALRGEPITIFGDGEQTRDFVYVKDVVAVNAFVAESPELHGVFNVAYGNRITVNELANRIISLTRSDSKITHLPPRPGDIMHSTAAVGELLGTGFEIVDRFNEGLQTTVEYFSGESH